MTNTNKEIDDEKLIIFGWITTILGIPKDANPDKYNELTDKIYSMLLSARKEEHNWYKSKEVYKINDQEIMPESTVRVVKKSDIDDRIKELEQNG